MNSNLLIYLQSQNQCDRASDSIADLELLSISPIKAQAKIDTFITSYQKFGFGKWAVK
ncbi:MAG: hypothetical protein AB4368_11135 [Xenococcaceae cyanobacterium]